MVEIRTRIEMAKEAFRKRKELLQIEISSRLKMRIMREYESSCLVYTAICVRDIVTLEMWIWRQMTHGENKLGGEKDKKW